MRSERTDSVHHWMPNSPKHQTGLNTCVWFDSLRRVSRKKPVRHRIIPSVSGVLASAEPPDSIDKTVVLARWSSCCSTASVAAHLLCSEIRIMRITSDLHQLPAAADHPPLPLPLLSSSSGSGSGSGSDLPWGVQD